jgi:hypothetical protein
MFVTRGDQLPYRDLKIELDIRKRHGHLAYQARLSYGCVWFRMLCGSSVP